MEKENITSKVACKIWILDKCLIYGVDSFALPVYYRWLGLIAHMVRCSSFIGTGICHSIFQETHHSTFCYSFLSL